jgi:hypothetical protein
LTQRRQRGIIVSATNRNEKKHSIEEKQTECRAAFLCALFYRGPKRMLPNRRKEDAEDVFGDNVSESK